MVCSPFCRKGNQENSLPASTDTSGSTEMNAVGTRAAIHGSPSKKSVITMPSGFVKKVAENIGNYDGVVHVLVRNSDIVPVDANVVNVDGASNPRPPLDPRSPSVAIARTPLNRRSPSNARSSSESRKSGSGEESSDRDEFCELSSTTDDEFRRAKKSVDSQTAIATEIPPKSPEPPQITGQKTSPATPKSKRGIRTSTLEGTDMISINALRSWEPDEVDNIPDLPDVEEFCKPAGLVSAWKREHRRREVLDDQCGRDEVAVEPSPASTPKRGSDGEVLMHAAMNVLAEVMKVYALVKKKENDLRRRYRTSSPAVPRTRDANSDEGVSKSPSRKSSKTEGKPKGMTIT